MTSLHLISVTARTATILQTPQGTLFRLREKCRWRLVDSTKRTIAEGVAFEAPLFFENLTPDSAYRLISDVGELAFTTNPCNGLINASDFGADVRHSDNTEALQQAIDHVPPGGTVRLAKGRFFTRPLFLKPNITLYIPEGAALYAIASRSGWPTLPARNKKGRVIGTWEGLPELTFAAVVTAIDCDGLKITGRGTIDGGGDRGDWWQWPKETRDGARRPRTIYIAHSNDVSLTGLTVRNSPSWTIHPYCCDRFTAAALKIENPPDSPNTDGLNPESCRNVKLTGLNISVGDDCIAIKSGKRSGLQIDHLAPTQGVGITHCKMADGHGAVVLGSEMSGNITDINIENCEFHGTDRGLRIKTRRGRGGRVAQITMRDVEMSSVQTPFVANAYYFCDSDGKSEAVQSREPSLVNETTPVIENIHFTNVRASQVQLAAAALLGLPEAPIKGVLFSCFQVDYDPDAVAGVPLMASRVSPVKHARIVADFAEVTGNVQIINHK